MNQTPTPAPVYEATIPDMPNQRTIMGVKNNGDVVVVFKNPTVDTLMEDGPRATMMAAQFLQKLKDNPPPAAPAGSLAD